MNMSPGKAKKRKKAKGRINKNFPTLKGKKRISREKPQEKRSIPIPSEQNVVVNREGDGGGEREVKERKECWSHLLWNMNLIEKKKRRGPPILRPPLTEAPGCSAVTGGETRLEEKIGI